MTDTTLPPEVATAVNRIGIYVDEKLLGENLDIIRDHLHRLAEENARLLERIKFWSDASDKIHDAWQVDKDRAEKAEARVQELERENVYWQPIETAPKDEWIIGCAHNIQPCAIYRPSWADAWSCAANFAPSHWLPRDALPPLPPPPSVEDGE